jgi:thiol-disulfide isomerase/thioredoxin
MKFSIPFLFIAASLIVNAQERLVWEEVPQFVVEINGRQDVGTKLYQPQNHKPFMLLRSGLLTSPVLIDLGGKSVSELTKKEVLSDGEYSVATKAIPRGRPAGMYTMKDNATVFSVQGKALTIRIKPDIIGETNESFIYQHSPLYMQLRNKYKPKKSAVEFVRKYPVKTDVVVIFATWCPTCKKVLPRFLRLMKDASNNAFSVKYFGLAMGGSEPRWITDRYGKDYPAFIFYQNGKERGRIFGDPPGVLEDGIVNLLK